MIVHNERDNNPRDYPQFPSIFSKINLADFNKLLFVLAWTNHEDPECIVPIDDGKLA